jgi:hypothetical protein
MNSARLERKIARYHPFLEPDEQILLPPLEGSTIRSILTWIPFHIGELLENFVSRTRLILVTDRAVVIFKGSKFRSRPKAVLVRLPPETILGPITRHSSKLKVPGHRVYVKWWFHEEVEAADAIARQRALQDLDSSYPREPAGS